MQFNKVISLGPSCETAYQIRQIVEQEEAYVFDWMIASTPSVVRALSNQFGELVRADGLSLRTQSGTGHGYVADSITGMEFHHDFRNDETFLETLEDVQAKYAYLSSRMLALMRSDSAVLFVHAQGSQDEARLLDSVIAEHYPTLSYRLLELAIGSMTSFERDGRLIFANISGDGTTWQERTPQWAIVFDQLIADSYGRSLKQRLPDTRDAA